MAPLFKVNTDLYSIYCNVYISRKNRYIGYFVQNIEDNFTFNDQIEYNLFIDGGN